MNKEQKTPFLRKGVSNMIKRSQVPLDDGGDIVEVCLELRQENLRSCGKDLNLSLSLMIFQMEFG